MYSGILSRFTVKRFAAGHVMSWHTHPHASVCVLLRGSMFEATPTARGDHDAGALIYKPAAVNHCNAFGMETHVLTLDLHGLHPGMPDHPVALRSQRVRSLAARIARELASTRGKAASELLIDGLGLELVAEIPRGVARARTSVPRWLEAIHLTLRQEFRAPRTIAVYAAAAGVHPTHLTQQFKIHFGESIGECVRRLRLDFASQEMTRTRLPLSQIAVAAGFADQSHFSHVFRRERGMTPTEFRRQC